MANEILTPEEVSRQFVEDIEAMAASLPEKERGAFRKAIVESLWNVSSNMGLDGKPHGR